MATINFHRSKYLHASNYVANILLVARSSFILNYVDPYPHVEYQPVLKSNNNSIGSKNDGNSVRNRSSRKNNNSIDSSSHAIIPIDQNGKNLDNNDGNSGSYNSSNMSLASIFKIIICHSIDLYWYITILLQRILITLPSPLMCSLFGVIVTIIGNANVTIWLSCTLILSLLIILTVYYLYDDICDIMRKLKIRFHNAVHFSKETIQDLLIKAAKRNTSIVTDNNIVGITNILKMPKIIVM